MSNEDDIKPDTPALLSAFSRIGRVEGRMDSLENRFIAWEQKIESRLNTIDNKLEDILKTFNQGSGGWKVIQILGWLFLALPTIVYTYHLLTKTPVVLP